MLSILIPCFNQDLHQLVCVLHKQCISANIIFEILAVDDASHKTVSQNISTVNEDLNQLAHVRYSQLEENLGRSKIRNYLGTLAQYPWLLFLDGDVGISNPQFIQNYLNLLPLHQCIYGGCQYESNKPASPYRLHWIYGTQIENPPVHLRKIEAHGHFHTVNFLCSCDLLQRIPFPSSLNNYGYEDSCWALALKEKNIHIEHIDNPVIHLGLDTAEKFLKKKDSALKNLVLLETNGIYLNTKLQQWYSNNKNLVFFTLIKLFFKLFAPIASSILTHVPNISLFRIYQISRYIYWKSEQPLK